MADTNAENMELNNEEKAEEAPENETQKKMKKIRRSEKSVKRYEFFVLKLLILIFVIWLLFFKFLGFMKMPTGDMYPRLDAGDTILYYRLDKDVKAQDVIVLEKDTPDSQGDKVLIVSRVVAAGGDTVEVTKDNRLTVNGNPVIESNIFYSTPPYEGYTQYPLTLAEDECFVLADMREGGNDSRYFGPVKKQEILGTVITILRRNNL